LVRPIVAQIATDNSLVRFTQFSGLLFTGARNITPRQNNFTVLAATADDFPLYLQLTSENQRTLVLSVNLNQGDFALRTVFPILVSQALTHFRNSEDLQKAYSTGEPITLALQTEATQIILRSPSGREAFFPCQNGTVSLGNLDEVGVWTVLEPATERELARIACNLFNAAESNLLQRTDDDVTTSQRADDDVTTSQRAVGVGGTSQRAVGVGGTPPKPTGPTLFTRPIWFYLTLLALFFTAMEWFLYQRRWIE
jgi:hypothetical protein